MATAHITLTTGGGSVDFAATTGTINSTAAKNLTINSGAGNVFLRSIVGGANAIGNLTINATSASHTGDGDITVFEIGGGSAGAATVNIGNANTDDLNLTGDVFNAGAQTYTAKAAAAGAIDLTEGGGDIVFTTNGNDIEFNTGTIALSDGSDLSVSAGAGDITVYGIVGGSAGAGEDVTLDSTTGTVTLGAGGITGTGIEDVSIDADGGGAGVIVLQGDITTTGTGTGGSAEVGDVDFDGPVKIDGAVTITTDVGGSGSTENDGTIDFGSNTINSANTGNDTESLTLLSGSGAITLGTIGVTTPLDGLSINASANAAAALTIKQIGTFNSAAGVLGTTTIGNASTASVDLNAASFMFGSTSGGAGSTTINAAGDITTDADISIQTDHNITFYPNQAAGGGALKTTGDFDVVATTSNDVIAITGNIVGVNVGDGGDGTDEDITIMAGASSGTSGGTITLGGNIGTEINDVTLTAATAINLGGNITTVNAGNDVYIVGPAVLTADTTINTSGSTGLIDFSSTINNDGGGTPFDSDS